MIRIGFYVIISALYTLLPTCSALERRILQGQPLQQSQIQNCTLPDMGGPNVISLGMCPNQICIMPIAIGTPAQQLYMIADTGEVYLQILTNQTNQIGFNPLDSATFVSSNDAVTIQLGNGQQVPAAVANDLVTLNNGQDYSISMASDMLVVDQYVQNEYSQVISGVAGLGISFQYPNIFEVAYANGLISTPSYTISMANNQPSLYYNQLPSQIIDNSIFIESCSINEYALNVIGLFVGETQYTSGASDYAVISSGSSYFYLNKKVYDAAVNNFFNDCTQTPNGTTCQCNSTSNWPVFSFMFQGAEIYIPPQSYLVNLSNGNCTYGFGYIQNEKETMVLGSSFFLNYNLTFNPVDATIGMQGDLTPIQMIDFEYFIVFQYIFFVISIGMAIFAGILVWQLRVVQKQKPTRIIQFSISDRFIETE